jgi:electron transfer flavoprotein beta subunit
MKILVPVKRVPDSNQNVRVKTDGSGVDLADLKMSINPFDDIAVEEAIRIKERGLATEVIVVSCGPVDCEPILRAALAAGADRGILVKTDAVLQPLVVAKLLKAVCEREKPQLVICGKQSTDDNSHQTGQMLAALANWPQALCASKLVLEGGRAQVSCEIDGGTAVVEVSLPAVVSTDLRLNTPRYATMINLMKAKKKPIEVLNAAELGVKLSSALATLKVSGRPRRFADSTPVLPPFPWLWTRKVRTSATKVASVAELVEKLRSDVRVI